MRVLRWLCPCVGHLRERPYPLRKPIRNFANGFTVFADDAALSGGSSKTGHSARHFVVWDHIIRLRPLTWRQSISYGDAGNDEVSYLTTTCKAIEECDLVFSNGAKLRDFEVDINIYAGELNADRRVAHKLGEESIGGFLLRNAVEVYGFFYFGSSSFSVLWDQVCRGEYLDCKITLDLASAPIVFERRSLFNQPRVS